MDPNIPPQPTQPVILEDQTHITQSIVPPNPGQSIGIRPKLSKWIIVGAVILFLVIVGGVSAFVLNNNFAPKPQPKAEAIIISPTPTPDPTATWKTYSNNVYSIKYPATWAIQTGLNDKDPNCTFLNQDKLHGLVACSITTVNFSTIFPQYINNQNNPKITINGYDAYKDIGLTGKGAFYIINFNGQFVSINPGTILDKALFSQILSTFRFTNQSIKTIPTSSPPLTTEPIANWKTFTSSDNSFSIKAPSSWAISKDMSPNPYYPDVNCLYLEENNSFLVSACYYSTKLAADSVFSKVPSRPDVKKTEINGYVTYNDKSLGLNDYYIIHPNGTFILITPGYPIDNDLFDKIVSTFKFTQ